MQEHGPSPVPPRALGPGLPGLLGLTRTLLTARNLFLVVALGMSAHLVYYFFTGAGGPVQLATRLLPVTVILWALRAYEQGGPYPRLGVAVNRVVTGGYILAALAVFGYFFREFENLFLLRMGSYNTADLVMGTLILLIIMEISRKLHPVLFGVNVVLIIYALFGAYTPIDFFWHPGASLERLVTSSTVELATGVFGGYTQMALTLIAAFLLLAAVARGFTAQAAVLRSIQRVAGRSQRSIPFTAVLSSASIGMVSGSGAANTAITGSFTIPLMKRHGLSGTQAGAVEAAASMGGLILPPLMAVAGFIMAEFLGVPYWEVAMRGFAIGFVYFAGLMLAVYLMSARRLSGKRLERLKLEVFEYFKTGFFFGSVAALIIMLGLLGIGTLRSALYAATMLLVALTILYIVFKFVRRNQDYQGQRFLVNLRDALETFADLAWYIVILLATLGIMIGLFTLTGFLQRMGSLLLDLTQWSIVATILVAWVFGWLAGTGLPPTATYVVVAVIIVPPLIQSGIDPWIAHFFAFLLAVWGELSPPTSLTAAVAARIAESSFMVTMFQALKICLPIVLMSFAIFVRSDAIVQQGWAQVPDTILLALGSMAVIYAVAGRFFVDRWADTAGRLVMAGLGAVVLFHPSFAIAAATSAVVLVLLAFGVQRVRRSGAVQVPAPAS
ncbi:MAG: TRAP transporter fused permease subunit [Micromonosporaceae bacterium]|nr:TRAP transporter fused permease subunit [Micromonosporaceae bacterium]